MEKRKFIKKAAVMILSLFLVLSLILFLPAGTFKWPEAWAYIAIQVLFSSMVVAWLMKHDPELLEKRISTKLPKRGWDRLIVIFFCIFMIPFFVVAGLEMRYGWSEVPLFVKLLSFVAFSAALYVVFLVMRENTFLSRVVEIQKKRKQKVITTGPYSFVRHPMYAAMTIYFFSVPLALGSLYALIPAAGMAITLWVRTCLEDKTLHKELKGYREYAKKVKYRLLPGVW